MDMFKMMGRIGEAKQRMEEARERLKNIELEEEEMDGAVRIRLTADRVIKKITLSEAFYSKFSAEEREDLLEEAINNALQKAEARSKEEMHNALDGLIPNIPGLGLNDLPFGL